MVKQNYRTLFLKEFTHELILNSKKERRDFLAFHPIKQETQIIYPIKQETQIIQPKVVQNIPIEIKPKQAVYNERLIKRPLQISHPSFQMPVQQAASIISPMPQPLPTGFTLGKLDLFILDNKITSIECQGPGKLVLVKSLGKVSSTQIILNQEEIQKIIEIFSKAAKIPVLGGVFKAAIGNLVITAVISDFVGSRFIINKYTPYSILEQVPQPQLR